MRVLRLRQMSLLLLCLGSCPAQWIAQPIDRSPACLFTFVITLLIDRSRSPNGREEGSWG